MPKNKSKKRGVSSGKKPSSLSTIRFSHPLVIISLGLITLLAAANIQTTHTLTAGVQSSVLGDDEQKSEEKSEEKKEEKKEDNKGSENKQEERKQEEQKKSAEQQREINRQITSNTSNTSNTTKSSGTSSTGSQKTKTETVSPSNLRMKTESERLKQETEIETSDGQKIKTKVEDDGTTKIEIENGTLKLRYKVENGQVVVRAENEAGEDVELNDDELEKLEDAVGEELDDDATLAKTSDNQLSVTKNQVTAVTDFPLSIDIATKQLIITTPDGQKTVTILPDQAVQNLLATGIINTLEQNTDTTTQEQSTTFTGDVKLEIRNNEVVYKVNGVKTHRMLGFIPVTTPVTAFVSADTGDTVAKQQSVLTNIVDLLSP